MTVRNNEIDDLYYYDRGIDGFHHLYCNKTHKVLYTVHDDKINQTIESVGFGKNGLVCWQKSYLDRLFIIVSLYEISLED